MSVDLEQLMRETRDAAQASRDLLERHVADDRAALDRIAAQLERLTARPKWGWVSITLPLAVLLGAGVVW